MLHATTPEGYRVVQVFLSPELTGACEVGLEVSDKPTKKVHCTCDGFAAKARCKHGDFVRKRIERTGGYHITVARTAPDELLAEAAQLTPAEFRELVLKYAKVEVL